LKYKYGHNFSKKVAVTASTGIAATHIGGELMSSVAIVTTTLVL